MITQNILAYFVGLSEEKSSHLSEKVSHILYQLNHEILRPKKGLKYSPKSSSLIECVKR